MERDCFLDMEIPVFPGVSAGELVVFVFVSDFRQVVVEAAI